MMCKRKTVMLGAKQPELCRHTPALQRGGEISWGDKKPCKFCGAEVVPSNKYICAILLFVYLMPIVFPVVAFAAKCMIGYRAVAHTIGLGAVVLYLWLGDNLTSRLYYGKAPWIASDKAEITLGKKQIHIRSLRAEKCLTFLVFALGVVTASFLCYILGRVIGNP